MKARATVPCNGCIECCRKDLLILHPELGDDPSLYQTMACKHPLTGRPAIALEHKPNGGCVYLGKDGCTIHGRAPAICREFDCRRFYLDLVERTTRQERKKMVSEGMISNRLLKAGRKRLQSLENDPL